MTGLDLDRIKGRADAATEGPWVALGNTIGAEVKGCTCGGDEYGHEQYCGLEGPVITGALPEDAEFIAAARTDVPALVAEVERLRGLVVKAWDEGKRAGITQMRPVNPYRIEATP